MLSESVRQMTRYRWSITQVLLTNRTCIPDLWFSFQFLCNCILYRRPTSSRQTRVLIRHLCWALDDSKKETFGIHWIPPVWDVARRVDVPDFPQDLPVVWTWFSEIDFMCYCCLPQYISTTGANLQVKMVNIMMLWLVSISESLGYYMG